MDHPLKDLRIGELTQQWAEQQGLLAKYKIETDSTNTWAKTEAFSESSLDNPLVVYLTESQSQGRGRGQNIWSNADHGSALLSTWSFDIARPLPPLMTIRFGMALIKACHSTWPFLAFSLKAPNDLFVGDKKVAGLLVETVSQGDDHRLLVGLGLNVFASPSEVKTSQSLLGALPEEIPLLGEDFIGFLDRWVFEVSESLSRPFDLLSETEQASVKKYLNMYPPTMGSVTRVEADGSYWMGEKKYSWIEL
jgi:BirA family biotin operon repressor/biotin-[acetyl-CoA-carboxylase] ligase